jgi:hypothetical protein
MIRAESKRARAAGTVLNELVAGASPWLRELVEKLMPGDRQLAGISWPLLIVEISTGARTGVSSGRIHAAGDHEVFRIGG